MGGNTGVMDPPDLKVYVLDTSALLEAKRLGPTADEQARVLDLLDDLVASGRLAFPLAVKEELTQVQYVDSPAVWAARVIERLPYPTAFSSKYLAKVRKQFPSLGCRASDLVAQGLVGVPAPEGDAAS